MNKRYLLSDGAKDSLIHVFLSWGDNALPERFFALTKEQNDDKKGRSTTEAGKVKTQNDAELQKH